MKIRSRLVRVLGVVALLLAVLPVSQCSSTLRPFEEIRVDSNLKRGPYVQRATPNSALIIWQTHSPTSGAVAYGRTDSLGTTVPSAETGTMHVVALENLDPDTQYSYRVLDGDRPLSRIVRFRTNPGPAGNTFTFLVIGDSGTGNNDQLSVARLVNQSEAALALHTGDVVYPDGEEEFYDPRFFHPYAPFLATRVFYPSIGNHDLGTEKGAAYFRAFHTPANNPEGHSRYYSFDYGHAHFVSLNTDEPFGPASAQYQWLVQDLAATDQPWKFVFFHRPPYSAGFDFHADKVFRHESLLVRQHLVPLFEQYGVDVVFAGHAHHYERTFPIRANAVVNADQEPDYRNPPGPIYIVTGGGGGHLTWFDPSPLNAVAVRAFHIVEIEMAGNVLAGRLLTTEGQAADLFFLRKGSAAESREAAEVVAALADVKRAGVRIAREPAGLCGFFDRLGIPVPGC